MSWTREETCCFGSHICPQCKQSIATWERCNKRIILHCRYSKRGCTYHQHLASDCDTDAPAAPAHANTKVERKTIFNRLRQHEFRRCKWKIDSSIAQAQSDSAQPIPTALLPIQADKIDNIEVTATTVTPALLISGGNVNESQYQGAVDLAYNTQIVVAPASTSILEETWVHPVWLPCAQKRQRRLHRRLYSSSSIVSSLF